MVATAIYSVTMVLWKETAFPLCRAIIIIITYLLTYVVAFASFRAMAYIPVVKLSAVLSI